jgi:hypothetical protein
MSDYPLEAFEDARKDVGDLDEHLVGQFWELGTGSPSSMINSKEPSRVTLEMMNRPS